MKTAKEIYDEIEYEALNEDIIIKAIKEAQKEAINEASITIKKEYPAGLTNTAKYISEQVLKLKEKL